MLNPLENPVWYSLTGPHSRFSAGSQTARRFAKGFSPILGFADPGAPELAGLLPFCDKDERFYTADWAGVVPAHWVLDAETTMFRMVWAGKPPTPGDAPAIVKLNPSHADATLMLADLTQPGPFGPRTIELGDYLGIFDGGRLVAMAGERMHAGQFREISGVCTLPDYQGRGFARELVVALLRRQLARNETPFLHVMSENTRAHDLYLRLGFKDYAEPVVRVITRL